MKARAIEGMTIVGVLALAACTATTTPRTDAQMGESLNLLKAQQVLNPSASRDADPVSGMDGKAAKGALDNYNESFRKPVPQAPGPLTTTGSGSTTK